MPHTTEHWITKESVSVSVCDGSKESAIDQMIALLDRTGFVQDKKTLRTDILNREAIGSTAVADGIDMPHAVSAGVTGFCASLGIAEHGRIYLLTAWPDISYKDLRKIAAFIELFQEPDKKARLLEAADVDTVFSILTDHFKRYDITL